MEADALQPEKNGTRSGSSEPGPEIGGLIQLAQAGEFELAYVDKAGFALQPPNRSGWSPVGERHAVAPSRSPGLNLIGALASSGGFAFARLWQSVNGLWVFGFLMALIERIQKPPVVTHPYHTAKALAPYWQLLKDKGLRFCFLPPYRPELNRNELLWKR